MSHISVNFQPLGQVNTLSDDLQSTMLADMVSEAACLIVPIPF